MALLLLKKIGNSEIDEANMDAVMQVVMKRINDNIFQTMSPPPSVAPASAEMPNVSDRFGGVGYNASFKHVHYDASYVDSFEWNERKIVDRKTLAGGFIGLGKYSPEIRQRAVKFVPPFNWDLAHFILPDITDLQQISQVTVNTELLNVQDVASTQIAIWKPIPGWKSVPGNRSITSLDFAIAPLLKNGAKPEDLKFRTTTTVLQAGRNTSITQTQNAVQGGIPVAPPVEGFMTVIFDPSDLQFKLLIDTAHLQRVSVTMRIGTRTFNGIIQPVLKEGKYQPPTQLAWVVNETDVNSQPIIVDLQFDYSGKPSRTVIINDLLKANNQGVNYFLRDPAVTLHKLS